MQFQCVTSNQIVIEDKLIQQQTLKQTLNKRTLTQAFRTYAQKSYNLDGIVRANGRSPLH
jgi:hypothetical protein